METVNQELGIHPVAVRTFAGGRVTTIYLDEFRVVQETKAKEYGPRYREVIETHYYDEHSDHHVIVQYNRKGDLFTERHESSPYDDRSIGVEYRQKLEHGALLYFLDGETRLEATAEVPAGVTDD